MGKFEDLTGQKFGHWTVLKRVESNTTNARWLCRCDCGNTKAIIAAELKRGHSTNCGCERNKRTSERSTTHGGSKSRLYRIWHHMKGRCNNPTDYDYPYYGGSGKKVCPEWNDNFENFYKWAQANGYQENLTIDRIDNTRGYSPDNCRWITQTEQTRNKGRRRWAKKPENWRELVMEENRKT